MSAQPFLIGEGWIEVRDGDPTALDLYRRHYSFRPRADGAAKKGLLVGPGFKLVLISADGLSLCAWRKAKRRLDGQAGIECCVFRREGGEPASLQIGAARRIAERRFPGERLFTFVDPRKVAPTWRAGRPTWGHCFYQDGWRFAGISAKGLHILDRVPDGVEA